MNWWMNQKNGREGSVLWVSETELAAGRQWTWAFCTLPPPAFSPPAPSEEKQKQKVSFQGTLNGLQIGGGAHECCLLPSVPAHYDTPSVADRGSRCLPLSSGLSSLGDANSRQHTKLKFTKWCVLGVFPRHGPIIINWNIKDKLHGEIAAPRRVTAQRFASIWVVEHIFIVFTTFAVRRLLNMNGCREHKLSHRRRVRAFVRACVRMLERERAVTINMFPRWLCLCSTTSTCNVGGSG